MLGMHGVRSTNHILQEADLLIVLVRVLMTTGPYGQNRASLSNAKIIHVDIDCAELG
ncbi:hypothetical protein ACLK1S_22700 [Escherichia coli]